MLAPRRVSVSDFEKLGVFYLGRVYDPDTGTTREAPLLYESKDLTTHALCVGMTGSGKTGLCVSLLEEAASSGSVDRAASAARSASRAHRESGDVDRAEARVEELSGELEALQDEFEEACRPLKERIDPAELEVVPHPVKPRKGDLAVDGPRLAWLPWWVSPQGVATRAW